MHNIKEFNKSVKTYQKLLKGKVKGEIAILFETTNKDAFFSIAPLSLALHNLGCDVKVFSFNKGKNSSYEVLEKIYSLFSLLKSGKKTKQTKALENFLKAIKKQAKASFEPYLKKPLEIIASKTHFRFNTLKLPFASSYIKPRLEKELSQTAKNICKNAFNLKKHETFLIGFELIPKKRKLPLNDYLDSYLIAYSTYQESKKFCKNVFLSSASSREKMTDDTLKTTNLLEALRGCQASLFSNKSPFKEFKKLSPFISGSLLQPADAVYLINGEGYGGKTFFGTKIGYPIPKSKLKWTSSTSMFLKPPWMKQTEADPRLPKLRLAITETLPLENYTASVNQDYLLMRKTNKAIVSALSKSQKLIVEGKKFPEGQTKLEIDLSSFLKGKRTFYPDDADMLHLLDPVSLKKGIKAGNYGNLPAGEVFFTPEKINGTLLGDTTIHLDKSYKLSSKKPLIIKIKNSKFSISTKDKTIKQAFERKLKEAKKMISLYEKNKALPKETIEEYKRNFMHIGEFAINTNRDAKPSRYLIEAEKTAGMVHLAVGSGFEPGTQTTHHSDTVVNAKRQKLNIYGISPKGKKIFIMQNGKLVV